MTTPTSDQLRDRIDKGLTGEKVAMPDPATVPLGTDAEAGGVSPSPAERKLDAANSPTTSEERKGAFPGSAVYVFLVVCLAIALVAIVVFAAS